MGAVASCVARMLPSAFRGSAANNQNVNPSRPPHTLNVIEDGEGITQRAINGTYFGKQFIMGGRSFDVAKPDTFLFGDNSDLELIGSKAVDYPYHVRGSSHPFKVLNALINVRRDSIKFVKVTSEDEPCYRLEFIFDSDTDCYVQIHFLAKEFVEGNQIQFSSKCDQEASPKVQFTAGADQSFDQFLFYPDNYDFPFHYEGGHCFPIVIEVRSIAAKRMPVQVQATYCSVDKSNDHAALYLLKPVKQKLIVDGVTYLMQEIYGIENKEVHAKSMDDNGSECVICLQNSRNTVILPCRHLCICNSCAETLKFKVHNCPICRSPFKALFKFILAGTDGQPSLVEALNGGSNNAAEELNHFDAKEMAVEAMKGAHKHKNPKKKAAHVLNRQHSGADVNAVEIEMQPISPESFTPSSSESVEEKKKDDSQTEALLPETLLHATVVRVASSNTASSGQKSSETKQVETKPYSNSSP